MTNHSLVRRASAFFGTFIVALFALSATTLPAHALSHKHKGGYILTITNNMADELLAPVLVTRSKYDHKIFDHDYVTPEAEEQVLSGDPAMLAKSIGRNAIVRHGADGPPGVLLAPGKSIEIPVSGRGDVRIFSMVAPTKFKDHFVTAVINPSSELMVKLDRYDIGHDEGTKSTVFVSSAAATVTIRPAGDKDGMMKDDMMKDDK